MAPTERRPTVIPFKSCDFETCLIRPALQSPPIVCMSTATEAGGEIFATQDVAREFTQLVTQAADGKVIIVGHNFAYDAGCALQWVPGIAEPLFAAYDRGGIVDTGIFERIAEIGKYTPRKELSLERVGAAYGITVVKDPSVRLGYGQFYGRPLSDYPPAFKQYPVDDAVNTLTLFERQLKRHGKYVHLADVAFLCRKQFWLQLTRNWGLKIDPARTAQLRKIAEETLADLLKLVQDVGFVRADGTRDMKAIKAAVAEAYEGLPPLSDTGLAKVKEGMSHEEAVSLGYVSTAGVTLKESGEHLLEQFAEFGEWSSVLKKDVKLFETITHEDGSVILRGNWPVHTKYGIADTTRSTSAKPNVQNPRRKAGIRECFMPREGHVFVSVDHGGLELCTLAQRIVDIFRTHIMADKINAGIDLHCDVAKEILSLSYDETFRRNQEGDEDVKNKRNCAKVVNFGRPGFMGAPTLVHYAKHSYKVKFEEIAPAHLGSDPAARALAFSKQLIAHWERANPEGKEYLQWAKRRPEAAGGREILIPGTTILRRGATVAATANTGFQGLGAVLEAFVGWTIAKEIYTGSGVLSKCRLVNFVHDEFILEVPVKLVTEAAARLEVIMATAPRKYLPDVKIGSEAVAMTRWSKKAKRIVVNGELIPWSEKQ